MPADDALHVASIRGKVVTLGDWRLLTRGVRAGWQIGLRNAALIREVAERFSRKPEGHPRREPAGTILRILAGLDGQQFAEMLVSGRERAELATAMTALGKVSEADKGHPVLGVMKKSPISQQEPGNVPTLSPPESGVKCV